MLSEKDKEFITYWEKERERQNSVAAKLFSGIPMAILFSIPILLFITAIYLFLPEWYTKVSGKLPGSISTIVVALIICTLFFAYFRMQFKWESNEQHYRELIHKKQKNNDFLT
jgi:uncharacterized BrkB/YihY/UPF0761 family membrane protein